LDNDAGLFKSKHVALKQPSQFLPELNTIMAMRRQAEAIKEQKNDEDDLFEQTEE
jgi:hypothetical protein